MRSLASGFTLELRACLNCIARVASVSAKRALQVGLDLTRPMVGEVFELLSCCCMATPRVASSKLVGHLSFGRPRSRDAIWRTFRKKPTPRGPKRSAAATAPVLAWVSRTTFCNPSQLRTLRTSICSKLGDRVFPPIFWNGVR